MIHNFKSEIGKIASDPIIKACLIDLYKAEEDGKSDPSKVPSLASYGIIIDAHYNTNNTGDMTNDA